MDTNQTTPSVNQVKSSNKAVIFIIAAIVIVTVSVWGYSSIKKSNVPTQTTNSTSLYKDGTYATAGDYTAPSGKEAFGVSLTIANDIVKDTSVDIKATNDKSIRYQTAFDNNYKQFVIGKNINEIKLDKVAGASLTTKGFEVALADIKKQAK